MLRAVTLDYWDTIYHGASEPVRVQRRREALLRLVQQYGRPLPRDEFDRLYLASAVEATRWWRDDHRGYRTVDRINWLLGQLEISRPGDCPDVARVVDEIDATLLDHPPAFLPGAREALVALSERYTLAIVSDTGFASGAAQDRVLERDGVRALFSATVYSMDVGFAKPRREPFHAALAALGVRADEALHVGDLERTDIAGALQAGMRAVRLDAVRESGPTAAEYVATSLQNLAEYLLKK